MGKGYYPQKIERSQGDRAKEKGFKTTILLDKVWASDLTSIIPAEIVPGV